MFLVTVNVGFFSIIALRFVVLLQLKNSNKKLIATSIESVRVIVNSISNHDLVIGQI